ncbi:alkaline shock response membrane anchor protein AmaP [Kitasatospora sp. NPDC050543]|uniref:alkaline shock response membrane anchor protein AmaP n=1 Tax=Kitasatospora sp. NPDC050543 TaxID=3364054 RepID=UPI0037AE0A7C
MSRTAVNRVLLALAGVVVLIVGLLVLAGGLDLYRRLGIHPPRRWPLLSPARPLLSRAALTRWTGQDWWWPAVIGGLSLAVAGAAWWLLAQLRRPGPSSLRVPVPAGSTLRVKLRARALEDVLEAGTAGLPEVERARVRLTGAPRRPGVRGAAVLAAEGDPAVVVERFDAGPLLDARSSLGLAELPAELRLWVTVRKPVATAGRRAKQPRVL